MSIQRTLDALRLRGSPDLQDRVNRLEAQMEILPYKLKDEAVRCFREYFCSQGEYKDRSAEECRRVYDEFYVKLQQVGREVVTDFHVVDTFTLHIAIMVSLFNLERMATQQTLLNFTEVAFSVCDSKEELAKALYSTTTTFPSLLYPDHLWKLSIVRQWIRDHYNEVVGPVKRFSETTLSSCFQGQKFQHDYFEGTGLSDHTALASDLRGVEPSALLSHYELCCNLIANARLEGAEKESNDEVHTLQLILIALTKEMVAQRAPEHTFAMSTAEFLLGIDPELNGEMPHGCVEEVITLCRKNKDEPYSIKLAATCLDEMYVRFPGTTAHAVLEISGLLDKGDAFRDPEFKWLETLDKCMAMCKKNPHQTARAVLAIEAISADSMADVGALTLLVTKGHDAAVRHLLSSVEGNDVSEKVANSGYRLVATVTEIGHFGSNLDSPEVGAYLKDEVLVRRLSSLLSRRCEDGWKGKFSSLLFECFEKLSLAPASMLGQYRNEICTNAAGWAVFTSCPEQCNMMINDWVKDGGPIEGLHQVARYAQDVDFPCHALYQHAQATAMDEFTYGYLATFFQENESALRVILTEFLNATSIDKFLREDLVARLKVVDRDYYSKVGKMSDTILLNERVRICTITYAFAFHLCGSLEKHSRRWNVRDHHWAEVLMGMPMERSEDKVKILSHLSLVYFRMYIRNKKVTKALLKDFRAILEYRTSLGEDSLPLVYLYLQHASCLQKLCQNDPKADKKALKASVIHWMKKHAELKKGASSASPPPVAKSPSLPPSPPPSRAAAGSTSPPASRRKRKKKLSPLKNMSLEPGVYCAQDFPPARAARELAEQISPHLDLAYMPFEVDPNLQEQLETKQLISKVADRAPKVNEPRRHFDSELDRLGLDRPPVVLRARYLRLAKTAAETKKRLGRAQTTLGRQEQDLLALKERVVSLDQDLAGERAVVARQAETIQSLREKDRQSRQRAHEAEMRVKELESRPRMFERILLPTSCEVSEGASLYCPLSGELPKDPVILASEDEAIKLKISPNGFKKVIFERCSLDPSIKVKKAPSEVREMIQLTRMKEEGVAGDLSFAKDAIVQMERVNLNLNSDPVTNILNRLGKVLTARMDVGSGIASRCQDLVGKTNTALEIVLKACLKAKKVDIANPSFAHQRVSIGQSHKLVSLANLLLSHLKFLKDKSVLQREIDQMDQNGFDRFDGRYLGEQKKTPLTTLMEEVENIDEDACMDEPASQIALIEQVREIYTMCSNVIGLAAQLMQATHDELI
ncbi:MAG: hypothetical protein S4CHLAM102_11570 [Chlamydiia bacterium]|nr:hypothetical protein [Chlamydiia bacterium]